MNLVAHFDGGPVDGETRTVLFCRSIVVTRPILSRFWNPRDPVPYEEFRYEATGKLWTEDGEDHATFRLSEPLFRRYGC